MRRVLAFYKFTDLTQPEVLRGILENEGKQLTIKGTILLAPEGVNGTIVGEQEALLSFQQTLTGHFGSLPFKWSDLARLNPGFYRFKVRVKPEIVSFGVPGIDPEKTGEHVSPQRWNELLSDPHVVVVDTRNSYEVDIGTFPGAVAPNTTNFREFPAWVEQHLNPHEHKQVAMFCTGGIRCEKASALLLAAGFENVYQLDGGILRYLENVPAVDNQWDGECFVFDQRVSVNADLEQGEYEQCFACRHPLSVEEMKSPQFEQGVSCPHCFAGRDKQRLESLRERQRQVELAAARGEAHIGQPTGAARS